MKHYTRFAGLMICSLAILFLAFPAAAADLNGQWNFLFNTEAGVIEAPATLAVEGENVTIKMGETELKGTLRESKVEVSGNHYSPEAGYEAPLKLVGKVDGNEISGDGEFDMYTFTFDAKKGD